MELTHRSQTLGHDEAKLSLCEDANVLPDTFPLHRGGSNLHLRVAEIALRVEKVFKLDLFFYVVACVFT